MLQNAYLVAKIGADTAENEQNFADRPSWRPDGPGVRTGDFVLSAARRIDLPRGMPPAVSAQAQRQPMFTIFHISFYNCGVWANVWPVLGCIEAEFCK